MLRARPRASASGVVPRASTSTRWPLSASSMAPRATVVVPSERTSTIRRATTGGSPGATAGTFARSPSGSMCRSSSGTESFGGMRGLMGLLRVPWPARGVEQRKATPRAKIHERSRTGARSLGKSTIDPSASRTTKPRMASDPFESEAPSSRSRIPARDLPGDPTLVWIPGGRFRMGSNQHYPEEAPEHDVEVDGFWMDRYLVTNADFARFVRATGYVTVAERPLDPSDYPSVAPELLVPGSAIFRKPDGPVNLDD